MTNKNQPTPSILVGKGNVIQANYQDPGIPNYYGNPLIEALPPILSQDETASLLAYYPAYEQEQRKILSHLRLHLIQNALQLPKLSHLILAFLGFWAFPLISLLLHLLSFLRQHPPLNYFVVLPF